MSQRAMNILTGIVVTLISIVLVQTNNDIIDLNSDVSVLQSLHDELDLSMLDSCGIITCGYGHGSCVAIGSDLILTAGHCVNRPDQWIEINGDRYEIISEWRSQKYDIGFVRIEGEIPYLELGKMPGILQTVYLVGNPYSTSFEDTVTKGIISKLGVDWQQWSDVIQTDAEGAGGSSGGPMLNKDGEIIGICVAGPHDGGGVSLCESVAHIKEALEEYNDSSGV